jgi:chromosome segregation ATPase
MEARLRELSGRLDASNQALSSLRSQATLKKQSIERDQSEMERYQEEVVRLDRQIGELMKRR